MKKLYTALILAGAALTASPQLTAQTTDMPYEISFTSSNYNTWTAVDDNKYPNEANWKNLAWMWNNNSWWYSLTSAGKEASDDWVISPAFAISEGTQYEITYRIDRYTGDKIEATLELVDGLESPKGLQTIDTWEINADKGKDKTVTFTASTSGNLRFGIHMTMIYPGSAVKIQFKSFAIKALSKTTAPASVAALEVVPGANGAATATINFKTPAKDAEGNDLTGNVTVSLYREDEATPFFTSEALAPDTESSAVDPEALTGETWYIAKASNDGGESVGVRADAWIGEDEPLAVTDLAVTTGAKPTLTWTAPAGGVHGGYLNASALKYTVSRVTDGQLTKAGETTGTEFTDNDLDVTKQANVSYQVVAMSAAGLGAAAQSKAVNVGPQLALPFAESFANKSYTTSPWMQETVKNADGATREPVWEPITSRTMEVDATDDNPDGVTVTIASQDTDQGLMQFTATGQWTNYCESRLVMPAIDFSTMQNPVLTFYIFRESWSSLDPATQNGRNDDYITVAARSDNGEFVAAEGEFHRYGRQNDWELCEVPLYAFAGKDRVQVALVAHGVGNKMYVDNIKIEERTAHDLAVTDFYAPARVRVGEPSGINVTVKNNGGFTADSYTAELYKDGAKVETANGTTIAPGKTAVVTFDYTPANGEETAEASFMAKIVYAKDQDLANNVSQARTVALTAALLPAVNDLKVAISDNKLKLTWSKANYLPAETLVEDDGFETYEPFAINKFGDFTSYDLDGKITVPITGLTYPNAGEKMACQVMTPALTNIDPEELGLWAPHSGSSMVIFPQATSASGDHASNDWLVLPALSGNAQTIKMWVRCVNAENYPEYILGYYTTTGNPTDADDFLPCPGAEAAYAVPQAWTQIDYTVPAGAKFFALRHTSQMGYMLMLDDVTYQRAIPAITPDGYNVYCNGVKVNEAPVTECAYEHVPEAGECKYAVTAIYGDAESTASNIAELVFTGITGVGADSEAAEYYNLQGIRVDKPSNGVFIRRQGDKTSKVIL
jgi:putative fibronectin type III domain protein